MHLKKLLIATVALASTTIAVPIVGSAPHQHAQVSSFNLASFNRTSLSNQTVTVAREEEEVTLTRRAPWPARGSSNFPLTVPPSKGNYRFSHEAFCELTNLGTPVQSKVLSDETLDWFWRSLDFFVNRFPQIQAAVIKHVTKSPLGFQVAFFQDVAFTQLATQLPQINGEVTIPWMRYGHSRTPDELYMAVHRASQQQP